MKKKVLKFLTINDLDRIIKNYYKLNQAFITECQVGSINEQHNPKMVDLGVGAVLSITVECLK